jgi:hypothetical protein
MKPSAWGSAVLLLALVAAACSSAAPVAPSVRGTTTMTAATTFDTVATTTLPPTVATTTLPQPMVPSTTMPPTTTTTIVANPVHVFPLDPPSVGSYSPGGHAYVATDIFAPTGTRFVAVTSGVVQGVTRVDVWDPEVDDGATRGGLSVALVGDDGVRYYGSHLSDVAVGLDPGVRVEVGQLLGLVGVTGSARDTPSHLHFGISRPTTFDDWEVRRGEIDPVPLLDAWRAGDGTATPALP